MFINLIERVHEASDLETHESYYADRVLETRKDTKKNTEKLHLKRLAGLGEGRRMLFVRTSVHPDDPRYGQSRKQRRWRDRLLRRLLKRAQKVTPTQQEQVDEEVNKYFDKRKESGLVVPK